MGAELVMFLEVTRYDETPMRVTHHEPVAGLLPQQPPTTGSQPPKPSSGLAHSKAGPELSTKSSSISNVFSTELQYCMLVKVGVECETAMQDRLVAFRGSGLTWNQLLTNKTGPCMLQALLETTLLTPEAERYFFKVRCCTTDAAGANVVAERIVLQQRGLDWAHLHLFCNVHRAARSMSKGLEAFDLHISGLIKQR